MNANSSTIVLWIQNSPDTYQTILSHNGKQIQSGTSEYLKLFEQLNSQSLERYRVLTETIKRLTLRNKEHRLTFISGHFEQTDKSNRKICYLALVVDAKNKEEECSLLVNESNLYGCSICEENKMALKKKDISFSLVIILIIFVIVLLIWIFNNLKM
jgi:hypothetical protein